MVCILLMIVMFSWMNWVQSINSNFSHDFIF